MAPEPFAKFLARSFAVLRDEQPRGWEEICRQLEREPVLLDVDGEESTLVFRGGEASFESSTLATVRLRTRRAVIACVLSGRASLLDAVLDGTIELFGEASSLARFQDGLSAYLRAAVRAPSFPALFDEFQRSVTNHG
jgi:hypothetical protein